MSGWDWIHAGLELATYTQAQQAQRNLSDMKSSMERDSAMRALLEAMRGFIFDIYRDIQLAEEQLASYPQQVYIVARTLECRLANSGLTPELFPDFQDKDYVFKTQKKVSEVAGSARNALAPPQIQESEKAVQYIQELQLLQQAINSKSAHEALNATDAQFRQISGAKSRRNIYLAFGITGLIFSSCIGAPIGFSSLRMVFFGEISTTILGLILAGGTGAIAIGSLAALFMGAKTNTSQLPALIAQRQAWQNQLLPQHAWNQVVAAFGDHTIAGYQELYGQRLAFLNPLLGGDLQKHLISA